MSSTNTRLEYYQERNKRIVTFLLPSIEIKKLVVSAAKADGRTINGWLENYFVPQIEEVATKQLAHHNENLKLEAKSNKTNAQIQSLSQSNKIGESSESDAEAIVEKFLTLKMLLEKKIITSKDYDAQKQKLLDEL